METPQADLGKAGTDSRDHPEDHHHDRQRRQTPSTHERRSPQAEPPGRQQRQDHTRHHSPHHHQILLRPQPGQREMCDSHDDGCQPAGATTEKEARYCAAVEQGARKSQTVGHHAQVEVRHQGVEEQQEHQREKSQLLLPNLHRRRYGVPESPQEIEQAGHVDHELDELYDLEAGSGRARHPDLMIRHPGQRLAIAHQRLDSTADRKRGYRKPRSGWTWPESASLRKTFESM